MDVAKLMDRNDVFGQYPVVDAICSHPDLSNRDLLAIASVCKGTAQFRDVCVMPRLKNPHQIIKDLERKMGQFPPYQIVVSWTQSGWPGFRISHVLVHFRETRDRVLSGPRIFLNHSSTYHPREQTVVIRPSAKGFPTFESLVKWLLDNPTFDKRVVRQFEWIP